MLITIVQKWRLKNKRVEYDVWRSSVKLAFKSCLNFDIGSVFCKGFDTDRYTCVGRFPPLKFVSRGTFVRFVTERFVDISCMKVTLSNRENVITFWFLSPFFKSFQVKTVKKNNLHESRTFTQGKQNHTSTSRPVSYTHLLMIKLKST